MAVSCALLGQRVCLLPYSYQPIECFQRRAALLLQIKKKGLPKKGKENGHLLCSQFHASHLLLLRLHIALSVAVL
jgi:hypothetical protein